jgi:hypothetical protein
MPAMRAYLVIEMDNTTDKSSTREADYVWFEHERIEVLPTCLSRMDFGKQLRRLKALLELLKAW